MMRFWNTIRYLTWQTGKHSTKTDKAVHMKKIGVDQYYFIWTDRCFNGENVYMTVRHAT